MLYVDRPAIANLKNQISFFWLICGEKVQLKILPIL